MKNKKKALTLVWGLGGSLILVALLSFSSYKNSDSRCEGIFISINESANNFFITKEDVMQLIVAPGDSIIGAPLSRLNLLELENKLEQHFAVHRSEVFINANKELNIQIKQKKPIARVYNWNGDNFYLNEDGKLMTSTGNFSSQVLIVSGYINEPFHKRYKFSIEEIINNKTAKDKSLLDDIFLISDYIYNNKFWRSQVKQLYVNEDREFELVPTLGDHRVVFGSSDRLEDKFNKLFTFYKEALDKTGWWNRYSELNLKFVDQIVCVKK